MYYMEAVVIYIRYTLQHSEILLGQPVRTLGSEHTGSAMIHVPLEKVWLRALLKGLTVAPCWSWGLNPKFLSTELPLPYLSLIYFIHSLILSNRFIEIRVAESIVCSGVGCRPRIENWEKTSKP